MNVIIFTGSFKKRPTLKNKVCFGTINFDHITYSIVAFGDTANTLAKCQANQDYLFEGKLQQSKYNEEWRVQVAVSSVKSIDTQREEIQMPLGQDLDLNEEPLQDIQEKGDDLPF